MPIWHYIFIYPILTPCTNSKNRFKRLDALCNSLCTNERLAGLQGHSRLLPTAPHPNPWRHQWVVMHKNLENAVTWPAWENWNVFRFNWCSYCTQISDYIWQQPDKCTAIIFICSIWQQCNCDSEFDAPPYSYSLVIIQAHHDGSSQLPWWRHQMETFSA